MDRKCGFCSFCMYHHADVGTWRKLARGGALSRHLGLGARSVMSVLTSPPARVALRPDGMPALYVIDGAMDGPGPRRAGAVPTLRPATSSVIAKPAHPMRLWAIARGAELRFMQPHSPLHNTSGRLTYIEFLLPVPRVWPVGWAKAGVAQCQTNALRRNWGPA